MDGCAAACGRCAGRNGRPPPPRGTTCGYAVSRKVAPAMGGQQQGILAGCGLQDPPGVPAQLLLEPPRLENPEPDLAGSLSTRRFDEPPDAGRHVRWCGRGEATLHSTRFAYSSHKNNQEATALTSAHPVTRPHQPHQAPSPSLRRQARLPYQCNACRYGDYTGDVTRSFLDVRLASAAPLHSDDL